MSRTASNWLPNVAAPDLSNVLSLAGRAGSNEGYNQFMKELIQYKSAQLEANAQKREEKRKAAQDLGNEPESDGFWHKVGEWAADGFERVTDVISRFGYASANAAKDMVEHDQTQKGMNWFENAADDLFNIPHAIGEGWQGFTGKEKTTYQQVAALNAKFRNEEAIRKEGPTVALADKWWNDKALQALAGFAGDVLLDPTTYIGLGVVTKPLKAAQTARSVGKASKSLESFAEEAGKAGLKHIDETGQEVELDADLIYEALGGAARPGKTNIITSGPKPRGFDKADQARLLTENYDIIRKAIQRHPDLKGSPKIQALDTALQNLRRNRQTAIAKAAHDAYREGLTEYAAKHADDIPGDPTEFAQTVGETWDEALDTVTVTRAMDELAQWGGRKGEFPRPSRKDTPLKHAEWEKARVEKLDELLGDAYKSDPRITDEFRQSVLSRVDDEMSGARSMNAQQIGALDKQINDAYDNAWDAKRAGDKRTANKWFTKAKQLRTKRDNAYAKHNRRRANTFLAFLKQHTDNVDWREIDTEWRALDDQEKAIRKTLFERSVHDRSVGQNAQAVEKAKHQPIGAQEVDEEGVPIQQNSYDVQADSTEALQAEIRRIQREKQRVQDRAYLRGDDLETPEGASGSVQEVLKVNSQGEAVVKSGELDPETEKWAEAAAETVNERARIYANQKEETWRRENRETEPADEMFGGSRGVSPKIHIDDSDITLEDLRPDAKFSKEAREALEQRATELDRRVNKARAQGNLYQSADRQTNALRAYVRSNSDEFIRKPGESVEDFNKRVDAYAKDLFTEDQLRIARQAIEGNPTPRQIEARVTRLLNEETSKLQKVVKDEHIEPVRALVKSYRNKILKGKISNRQKMDIRHALNKILSPEGAKTKSTADYIDKVQDAVVDEILAVGKQSKVGDNLAREIADYAKKLADVTDSFGKKAKSSGIKEPLADTVFRRLFEEQHGMTVEAAQQMRKSAKAARKKTDPDLAQPSASQRAKWMKDGVDEAIKGLDKELKGGGKVKTLVDKSVNLRGVRSSRRPANSVSDIKEAHDIAKQKVQERYAAQYADEKAKLKATHPDDPEIERITARIEELKDARQLESDALEQAKQDAIRTAEALEKRMDEQVTLELINESMTTGKNYLRVTFAGKTVLDIPDFAHLTELTAAIAGLPIISDARRVWSQAFHPASTLEPELNLARLRVQSRTPEIIQFHVENLMKKFSHYKPGQRKAVLQGLLRGAPPVGKLSDDLAAEFNALLPYFKGEVKVGDETLAIREINRFLPEEFQLVHPKGFTDERIIIHNSRQLLEHIRRLKPNADPLQILWRMRIATEQALADKAMRINIKELFGVKRIIRTGKDTPDALAPSLTQEGLIEDLHRLHGWREVRDIGHDYYFAPEMADQIETLLRMMKPQFTHDITKQFDRVLRTWKGAVTVYNPGYYMRNGIGEFMMGMFDNVDVRAYGKASRILTHKMPDDVKEALKELEPWKAHRRGSTKETIVTLKGGKRLSIDDVWVLYHQAGLKTGFISQEFDHFFPSAGSMRASAIGDLAIKANDKVRYVGEKYEDYFRLAHFVDRLKRSNFRNPVAAAEDAAQYVRKYHFDYTDFTPFEKTVMMRIFPFYKWTRKALPLMASMLFTRPGMAMLYPKAMSAVSVATGGTDPLKDKNGWLPNYEKVTPEWVKGLFAYPIGEDEAGNMSYMNIANPPFDVYKMMQDPIGTTIGMLNPMLKMPIEQAQGSTMDPDFKIAFEDDKHGGSTEEQKRIDHLMRATPQTSWINQLMGNGDPKNESKWQEPGFGLDERTNSFLFGLGFYENNDDAQMGELLRQQQKGTLDKKEKKAMGKLLHKYKEEANK